MTETLKRVRYVSVTSSLDYIYEPLKEAGACFEWHLNKIKIFRSDKSNSMPHILYVTQYNDENSVDKNIVHDITIIGRGSNCKYDDLVKYFYKSIIENIRNNEDFNEFKNEIDEIEKLSCNISDLIGIKTKRLKGGSAEYSYSRECQSFNINASIQGVKFIIAIKIGEMFLPGYIREKRKLNSLYQSPKIECGVALFEFHELKRSIKIDLINKKSKTTFPRNAFFGDIIECTFHS